VLTITITYSHSIRPDGSHRTLTDNKLRTPVNLP
jgi:hypothetical protein